MRLSWLTPRCRRWIQALSTSCPEFIDGTGSQSARCPRAGASCGAPWYDIEAEVPRCINSASFDEATAGSLTVALSSAANFSERLAD